MEVKGSDSLSKACRNSSWSAWMCCTFGFLAAAIAADDDWHKPLAFPPDPKATRGFPAAEFCFCGAIALPTPAATHPPPENGSRQANQRQTRLLFLCQNKRTAFGPNSRVETKTSSSLSGSFYEHKLEVSVSGIRLWEGSVRRFRVRIRGTVPEVAQQT